MAAQPFPRSWLVVVFGLVIASSTLCAQVVTLQPVTFSGRVTTLAGQPIPGASVLISELRVGAAANADGRYSFIVDRSRVAGRTLSITARFLGYKPSRFSVTVTSSMARVDHDFALDRDVLNLEEIVVTGTSAATSQLRTPFAVGVVDAQQIKDVPSVSPLAALEGKIAGAAIVSTSGQPGAEPAIRLRAATSLTGRQDPLIIVDGTITRLGLADINSEDIERVEVIKGAAASSLYGSDAANGVLQIFTKRGASLGEGQTTLTVRNELGQSKIPKFLPENLHNPYEVTTDAAGHTSFVLDAGGIRITKEDAISDSPYPVLYDQYNTVFKPGNFLTNYVSVGQRRGTTNLNASFQNTHDAGVVENLKGYRRQNFRLNADQALTDEIDLGVGAFYGRSVADQGEATADFFGMRFLEPNVKLDSVITTGPFAGQYNPAIRQPPLSGNVTNPLYRVQQLQITNDRDRFTGTAKAAYRPSTWLTFDGNFGYDESGQNYKSYTPLGYANSSGVQGKGGLYQRNDADRSYNVAANATGVGSWRAVRNTTKAAFLYEDQTNEYVSVNASALTVPKVPEFSSASTDPANPISPGSRTETIRARDEFLVSTFEIKDRYILDGLVRRDESSLFGADARSAVYQRLSAAWRVTQDIHLPLFDELKLRVSSGTAGLRPPFSAQYEVLAVTGGVPEKITLGNTLLKPAFSRETEIGFDASLMKNVSLEYSYSKKRTTDEIIKVPLSSASGYQNQWQNAGTLSGYSHEVALGVVLMSKADRFWRVNLTADRTRQKIDDLRVGAFLIGPSEGTTTTQIFRIASGAPFGVIYGAKWVQTAAQLDETIKAGKLSGTAADYTLNEEGFYVKKADYHTKAEVPLKAWSCTDATCANSASVVQIGDVNPDFNMGLNTTFSWKSLSTNATLTWVKGGNIYNLTRQWPFNELRDAVMDQSDKPSAGTCPALAVDPTCPYKTGKKSTLYYSTFYNNIDPNSYFVEDGTYLRLRELSVNWQIPARFVDHLPGGTFHSARLGIVGRNLWTKTNYSGYDPDVTGPGGGNPFAYRVDYFTYPAYKTFTAMLEFGF
jgi:TonB-linked SusC/RagA family outer membrane protein